MFDQDGNGRITLDEIQNLLGSDINEKVNWGDMFEEGDLNGDNEITFEKFKSIMSKMALT